MTQSLYKRKILVRSGTEFGRKGDGHIRLSFAAIPTDTLKGMVVEFKKALDEIT